MTKARADIGFGTDPDEIAAFDLDQWQPKTRTTSRDNPKQKVSTAAAKATGFTSREPKASTPKVEKMKPRRRRTGRNAQLNLKVRPEDVQAFYDLCDAQEWVLGEGFQYAIQALKKDISGS